MQFSLQHSLSQQEASQLYRLRTEECPSEIIDAIGGWLSAGVGNSYGDGYPLEVKLKWMRRIIIE